MRAQRPNSTYTVRAGHHFKQQVIRLPDSTFSAHCVDAIATFLCPNDQADVNNDGRVNSIDIGMVASKYGQLPPPAGYDQNFDGTINSIDIGIMASQLNNLVTQCP